MLATNPICNVCFYHGLKYTFKSKNTDHLSLKIFHLEEKKEEKIKFDAVQLKTIGFQQEMVANPERLSKLLDALFYHQFLPLNLIKPPLTHAQNKEEVLKPVKDQPEEKRLLKPLEENPLKKTHPGGFCLGIDESHPYYKAHPDWCTAVQSNFPEIRQAASYKRKIQDCKDKMSLQNAEEGLSNLEQEYLGNIDRAIHKILQEFDKKKVSEQVVKTAIKTIYENIYQLIVIPIKEIQSYMRSSFLIFIVNQSKFRSELEKKLPTSRQDSHRDILDKVIQAIQDNKLEDAHQTLLKTYPGCTTMIDELIAVGQSLMQQAQAEAQDQIKLYLLRPEIKFCFEAIFSKCPDLRLKYVEMHSGRYSSFKEMPREISDGKIYYPSYMGKIFVPLQGCQVFEASSVETKDRLEKLKESCEDYFKEQKPAEHFQNNIQPLIFFLQCIKNILAWPKKYDLAEGEVTYITNNLSFLMGISNGSMSGKSFIPYNFLNISEEDQKSAETALNNKNRSSSKKRDACRTLFHARIPWKALQAIGSLLHTSGGVPQKEVDFNKELVRSSLLDLLQDLPTVERAIEELIEFEVTEFSLHPSVSPPKKLPAGCYTNIHLLGGTSEIKRNMKKVEDILSLWRNRSLLPTDFTTPKIKYSILRTIQILGEMSKNLRKEGVLSDDPLWDCLEELRDILSHGERVSVYKRLISLIDDFNPQTIKIFSGIFEDFRSLLEYFQERKIVVFNKAVTWSDRKRMHSHRKDHKTYLELNGLQNLYIYLTAKISYERRQALLQTLEKESAVKAREEIARLKKTFLQDSFEPTTSDSDIEKLPLGKIQKKELKEMIKTLTSSKAAKNNADAAKPGMLKKVIRIIAEDFKKNKNLACSYQQLNKLHTMLVNCEKIMGDSSFKDEIAQVKVLLSQIKQCWSSNQIQVPPQLKIVEDNLNYLTETTDNFVGRKRIERDSLLNTVQIYLDQSQVREEADSLIRSIQLGRITIEDLKLKIIELGVTDPNDKKIWEETLDACTKKQYSPQDDEEKCHEEDLLESSKKGALRCIGAIIDRLQRLDKLLLGCTGGSGLEIFQKDQLMQLACQYLVSDFRNKACILEDHIESIRHFMITYSQFFQDIQQDLISSIQVGNNILHVHEVTEPSSLTSYGHIFYLYNHIMTLLNNISCGKENTVSIYSLHQKMIYLRELLSNIR